MQPCELPWKTHERRNDPEIMKYRATITCCPIQLGSISSLRCQKSRSLLSIRTSKCEVMFRGRRYEQPVIKPSGGARRDRTDDLMLAKHALSQLSYGPVPEDECWSGHGDVSRKIIETPPRKANALDQSGGPGKT